MATVETVTETVFNRYLANHQALVLISDEPYRLHTQIQLAVERLKKERGKKLQVLQHDKLSGFHELVPTVVPPQDKSNQPLTALAMMTLDAKELNENKIPTPPFNVKHDLIFVLKDWDAVLTENPGAVQGFRNFIQSNMGSDSFYFDEESGETTRGKRMFIFIMSSDKIPATLPELKAHVVPLPDDETLGTAVDNVLQPLIAAYKEKGGKDGKGCPAPDKAKRQQMVTALQGSTYQFAEDTFSYAVAKHRGINDMPELLKTIEREKATYIAGVPGLTYIPREMMTPVEQLPGYEPAVEFIDECMSIDPDDAKKHRIQPLRGITLAGAPGTGKTQFGMAVAARANRILLLWSLGESQGSLVGESEANTRRAIQIAQAMHAVVLLDDVDKAGVSVATGGSTSSIEGGPFGRMIQMLLTEMSSNENQAIWVFTCNRINNLPPELIRPGRMDERFFVQRPDEDTRKRVLRVHLEKRQFILPDDKLDLLASSDFTDGWTGAELEDLVKKGVRRALKGKQELDYNWMCGTAKRTTPMIKQTAYAKDINEMEEFCETWTKLGRVAFVPTPSGIKAPRSARATRDTSI